jgi:hypothetical protein
MSGDHHIYTVKWSAEDGQYVAACNGCPSLSWLARTPKKPSVAFGGQSRRACGYARHYAHWHDLMTS